MKRLFLLTLLFYFLPMSSPVLSLELSNFFTPYGFRTPLLKQGQYALNFNSYYDRAESERDYTGGFISHYESIYKRYYFSINGIYAATDKLIFQGGLALHPGQTHLTSRSTSTFDPPMDEEDKLHSNFNISPSFNVSFRPQTNMEFYGTFDFSKEKIYWKNELGERTRDESRDAYHFDVGFTILGNIK